MTSSSIAALINLLGWTIGFALYAMLLAMSLQSFGVTANRRGVTLFRARRAASNRPVISSFDALPLATPLLGLVWNAGALATHSLQELGVDSVGTQLFLPLGAASYAALGFLPSVVVHSATSNLSSGANELWSRLLTLAAYTLSSVAAVMHFAGALTTSEPSSRVALQILTGGFALLMIGLFLLTRGETSGRRAVWAAALAVFAVSALHLSTGGTHSGYGNTWYTELIGHHASLPLALAILYQDYRFAFADIFLKRALSLLALVVLITVGFSFYASLFATSSLTSSVTDTANHIIGLNSRSLGVLLALWTGTALLYPWLQRGIEWFVDKIVLRRADYAALRRRAARLAQEHQSPAELLDAACVCLQPALTAQSVTWREGILLPTTSHQADSLPTFQNLDGEPPLLPQIITVYPRRSSQHHSATVAVPTTEAPSYTLTIGELSGGRRLLSDDIEMLESVAVTLARRIDALRVTHERCEQVQREGEIAKLATEAQLRALRAQINPHFLFNALTTIGYLIQTSPQRALETLMRLTDLLRRVLRANEELTTLGEELKLIESYLDIERARFEERLRVRVDVPSELHKLLVPSLVLQPIVENAIKHGITPLRAGGEIRITARTEHNLLILSVRDTGAGVGKVKLAEGKRNGVGLHNVEQRLRLCCGGEGELRFVSAPQAGATVELRVPVSQTSRAVSQIDAETSVTTATPEAQLIAAKAAETRRIG